MNDFLIWLDLGAWRPLLEALIMPPVPFIVLSVVGARLMFNQRLLAWLLVLLGAAGTWFSCTHAGADGLRRLLQPPTRALSPGEVSDLKRAPRTAIVVLGGGVRTLAPEYGVSDLNPISLDRLRYGLWLARETQLPVAFSGGRGHAARAGETPEADVAARVAERDFRSALRWQESGSRDTRENAIKTVALLGGQGIDRIVLVTHAYHIARAHDNFERAIRAANLRIQLQPAPMNVPVNDRPTLADFFPSRTGYQETRLILHEWVGRLIGA